MDEAAGAGGEGSPAQHRSRRGLVGLLLEIAERPSPKPFTRTDDPVRIDVRQHPIALLVPALRTVAGLAGLLTQMALLPLLAVAALTWLSLRARGLGLRTSGLAAGVGVLVLLVLGTGTALGWSVALVVLLLWLADDVLDWATDRLVVTTKRVYRRYGWVTTNSPSVALTQVVFTNVSVSPLGGLLQYGTVRLDSPAQRDGPLSRFDRVPRAEEVHKRILELRSQAMPRFPSS